MFIVRRRKRLEQIEKTEAKRILVPSSVRNPSVSALRSHTVVGGSCRSSETVADGGEGGKRARKKTGTSDEEERRQRAEKTRRMGERHVGWGEGGERRLCSLDDPERTIYQSVLSIIRVYSCRPRINPAPPSLPPLLFASVKFSRSPAVVLN